MLLNMSRRRYIYIYLQDERTQQGLLHLCVKIHVLTYRLTLKKTVGINYRVLPSLLLQTAWSSMLPCPVPTQSQASMLALPSSVSHTLSSLPQRLPRARLPLSVEVGRLLSCLHLCIPVLQPPLLCSAALCNQDHERRKTSCTPIPVLYFPLRSDIASWHAPFTCTVDPGFAFSGMGLIATAVCAALEVANVVGGVPQYPFTPNLSLSPQCQVNVNFKVA